MTRAAQNTCASLAASVLRVFQDYDSKPSLSRLSRPHDHRAYSLLKISAVEMRDDAACAKEYAGRNRMTVALVVFDLICAPPFAILANGSQLGSGMTDTTPIAPPSADALSTETPLRDIYATPAKPVVKKVFSHLDQHSRRFIELSPFFVSDRHALTGLATCHRVAASRASSMPLMTRISRSLIGRATTGSTP
jgi:hypothetical protein